MKRTDKPAKLPAAASTPQDAIAAAIAVQKSFYDYCLNSGVFRA